VSLRLFDRVVLEAYLVPPPSNMEMKYMQDRILSSAHHSKKPTCYKL